MTLLIVALLVGIAAVASIAFLGNDTFNDLFCQYFVAVFISFTLSWTIQSFAHKLSQINPRFKEHEIQQVNENTRLRRDCDAATDEVCVVNERFEVMKTQHEEEKQRLQTENTSIRRDYDAATEQNRDINERLEALQTLHDDSSARFRQEKLDLTDRYNALREASRIVGAANLVAQRRINNLYLNVPECAGALMAERDDWTETVPRLTIDGRPDRRYNGGKHFGLYEERHYTRVGGRRVYLQVKMASE